MRILVNAIPMTGLLTGVARYLRNLYAAMEQIASVDVSYFKGGAFVGSMPPLAESIQRQQNARILRALPGSLAFGLRAARWFKYEYELNRAFGLKCEPFSFDVYHETELTPAKFTKVPTLYSIYDLSLLRYRDTHPRDRVLFFECFIKTRLKYAGHILTISDFIRHEIIETFNLCPSMVSAVPLAPDPLFGPCSGEEVEKIRLKYRLPGAYLLFVSSLEPRKNIDILIEALEKASTDIPLILAGFQGWGKKEWLEKIRKPAFKGRVYPIGHVSDEDLKALYNGAAALVYPSLYEGFGLPIVEAMACGCPVICSNVASMPEVAGGAALLIGPGKSDELAHAIERLVHDTDLRASLVIQGLKQASRFTWESTAVKTLEVFKGMCKFEK